MKFKSLFRKKSSDTQPLELGGYAGESIIGSSSSAYALIAENNQALWGREYQLSCLLQSIIGNLVNEILNTRPVILIPRYSIKRAVYEGLKTYLIYNEVAILLGTKEASDELKRPVPKFIRKKLGAEKLITATVLGVGAVKIDDKKHPNHYSLETTDGDELLVHKSRIIYIKEEGVSYIGRIYPAIKSYEKAQWESSRMLENLSIPIFRVTDLSKVVSGKQNGSEGFLRRMLKLKEHLNRNSMTIIDKEREDISLLSADYSFFPDFLMTKKEYISAVSSIPLSKLFGATSGGFQNSDNISLENYRLLKESIYSGIVHAIIKKIYDALGIPVPTNLTTEDNNGSNTLERKGLQDKGSNPEQTTND